MRSMRLAKLLTLANCCVFAACVSGGNEDQSSPETPTVDENAATGSEPGSIVICCGRIARPDGPAAVFFDDFNYASAADMERNGWILRTAPGWPGVPGAQWGGNVTVGVVDPDDPKNRLIRMSASTDRSTTRQAQFCHQRKYHEGTYAARVYWRDAPVSGPDGDQVVETFYLIAPLRAPLDENYSEVDFEYLANGGWGSPEKTLFVTTWETFRPEPEWLQINTSRPVEGVSREGWHTLVVHVANQQVTYFIDDEPLATHGEPYYPEEPMSINFNLWFIKDQFAASREPRTWQQKVDWVFHAAGQLVSPAKVREKIAGFRLWGVAFQDEVPARDPPLNSPCNF